MKHLKDKAFSTRSVHAGERLNAEGINPVVAPIHPSVGYTFADSNDLDAVLGNEKPGFVYSTRYANPTVGALETAVSNAPTVGFAYRVEYTNPGFSFPSTASKSFESANVYPTDG